MYRTTDGGKHGEQVLFRGEQAGAIDLTMILEPECVVRGHMARLCHPVDACERRPRQQHL